MTSRRGPSPSPVSWPVSWSMPAWRASTAPDLVGSITKQTVSGPMKTHSHHFAGPSPSRGAKTRQVVSSACRCHESRDRAVMASASGASSAPACAHVPASVRRRDVRALPAQPGDQGVHAPPRREPLHEEHRDERVREQALADRLRRAGRRHRRRDPAIAGPPVPAPAVRPHPHDHQPVQLLRDMIAQQRERHPALRAAVPAPGKVPDHLEPRQMRVIPPPRPGPRAAPAALAAPGPAPRHRRRHPHGQESPASPAPTTSRTPSAAKPPGQRAAAPAQPPAPRSPPEAGRSPRAAHSPAAPAPGSPPAPQPAHPGATPQHPPDPGQHLPQPPRSTANTLTSRRSRTTPSVSPAPATRLPNTYVYAARQGPPDLSEPIAGSEPRRGTAMQPSRRPGHPGRPWQASGHHVPRRRPGCDRL